MNTERTKDSSGQPTTGYVISKDSLKIGYTKFGKGPAVVIVHGSYSIQNNWYQFASLLATTNTVYLYDRRGRGQSLDYDNLFSIQNEVDDLAAMINLAGVQTSIIGHSYGGSVVLNYIIQSGFTGRVVFYEPMNGIFGKVSKGLLPNLKALVDANKLEEATVLAQTDIVGFEPSAVEASKASPSWNEFTKMTKIFLRELEVLDNFSPTESQTDEIKAKTFLLLGTNTPHNLRITTAALAARVRGITMYPVKNQGHIAHVLDPEQLKDLVLKSLDNN
jgi:pimeloyl-ACP methyl ester carboxylesterase